MCIKIGENGIGYFSEKKILSTPYTLCNIFFGVASSYAISFTHLICSPFISYLLISSPFLFPPKIKEATQQEQQKQIKMHSIFPFVTFFLISFPQLLPEIFQQSNMTIVKSHSTFHSHFHFYDQAILLAPVFTLTFLMMLSFFR